jgi:hypothetical protein
MVAALTLHVRSRVAAVVGGERRQYEHARHCQTPTGQ